MAGLVPFNRDRFSLRPAGFEDFYNMLDDFFSDTRQPRRSLINDTFKVDLQENDSEYLVEAELPGVQKDEINLQLENRKLTISVNREENQEKQEKNYIHRERRYSSMQRSIYLQDAMNEEIKAKLENGVLCVTIPKQKKGGNAFKINIE